MYGSLFEFLKSHCKSVEFHQVVVALKYARGHISIDTNCIVFDMANERSRITGFFDGGDREGSEKPVILGEGQREEENPANGKFQEFP